MQPLWKWVLDSKVAKAIERGVNTVDLKKLASLFAAWNKEEGKGTGLVPAKNNARPSAEDSSRHVTAMALFNDHATKEQLEAWWEDMQAWANQKKQHEAEQHQQSLSNQRHGNWQGWLKGSAVLVTAVAVLVKAFKGK